MHAFFLSILAFFEIYSLGFWLLVFVSSCIIIGCTEKQTYVFPTIVAAVLMLCYWRSVASIDWRLLVIIVATYGVVGGLWSIFRWYRLVRSVVQEFERSYGTVLSSSQTTTLQTKTSATNYKSRILGWIAFWPWSAFWNIAGDFLNTIYESLLNVYHNISRHQTSKFTLAPDPAREDRSSRNSNR